MPSRNPPISDSNHAPRAGQCSPNLMKPPQVSACRGKRAVFKLTRQATDSSAVGRARSALVAERRYSAMMRNS